MPALTAQSTEHSKAVHGFGQKNYDGDRQEEGRGHSRGRRCSLDSFDSLAHNPIQDYVSCPTACGN